MNERINSCINVCSQTIKV